MLRELGVAPKTKKQMPQGLLDASGADVSVNDDAPATEDASAAEQVTIFEAEEDTSVESVVEQGIAESDAV